MPNEPWMALIGLTPPLGPGERRRLRDSIATLWEADHGPLADLDTDLTATDTLFNPNRKGEKVREALLSLPAAPPVQLVPPPPLVEPGLDGRPIVTPEGRVAIELLSEPGDAWLDIVIRLTSRYRQMSRHRVRQVVTVREGHGRPAQAPAVGLLVALLARGHVGREHALPRSEDERSRAAQGAALAGADAFAAVIAPSGRRRTKISLEGGWSPGELTRRLEDVVVDAAGLYVAEGRERQAAAAAGRLLAARKRLTEAKIITAIDALARATDDFADPAGASRRMRPREVGERVLEAFRAERAGATS